MEKSKTKLHVYIKKTLAKTSRSRSNIHAIGLTLDKVLQETIYTEKSSRRMAKPSLELTTLRRLFALITKPL